MRNKLFFILITLSLIVIFFLVIQSFGKKPTESLPIQKNLQTLPSSPIKAKTYQDEAGFKFSYPGDSLISPLTDSDDNTYSSLKVISNKYKGSIIINIIDTGFSSLEEYLEENDIQLSTSNSATVKLGDLDAKKITENNRQITVAIDNNILYEIKTDLTKNKDYWLKAADQIEKSFFFALPEAPAETETTDYQNSESDETAESVNDIIEEEVIE